MNKGRRIIFAVLSIILIAGLIGGYVFNFALPKIQDSQANKVSGLTRNAAGQEAENTSSLNDKLLRIDSQGNVEVGITLSNPIKDDDKYIVLKTQFDTHSVNLDSYDFSKIATFKTSDGIELKEVAWEKAGGGGHHYLGYYKVPKVVDGKSVITPNTKYIELDISGLDKINNRSFKWEDDMLKLVR